MALAILKELIKRFESNKELLMKQGWVVSDPLSYSWWGGLATPDEIAISAFLVQLTKWEIVKETITRLREKGLASIDALSKMSEEDIDRELRRINFHRTKACRLKAFSVEAVRHGGLLSLVSPNNEEKLMKLGGIGKETAKSLLLFVSHAPVFPPSKYASRVLSRIMGSPISYGETEEMVTKNIRDIYELKLLHAGLVSVGKAYCKESDPKCEECVLRGMCIYRRGGQKVSPLKAGMSSRN